MAQKQQAGAKAKVAQFLTFRLNEELYGIDILAVQEIKGGAAITPIPQMPSYVKGAMDLRGTIVPVVDLRAKYGLGTAEAGQSAVIVIVRVAARTIGLMVDAVSDVLDLPVDDIQPPPDLGVGVDVRFLRGLARAGEQLVLLLDLGHVFNDEELTTTDAAVASAG